MSIYGNYCNYSQIPTNNSNYSQIPTNKFSSSPNCSDISKLGVTCAFTSPSLLRLFLNATRAGCVRREWVLGTSFSKRPCCRGWPKAQYSAAGHRGAHRKQAQRYWWASLQEQSTSHRPTGDLLHYCGQASDSQLLTSWVSPEQERLFTSSWTGHWSIKLQSNQRHTEWLCVDVNVYKALRSRFTPTVIPTFPHPTLYVGDFNCQHVNWGYNKISWRWRFGLLINIQQVLPAVWPKGSSQSLLSASFNADLAFASVGHDNRLPVRSLLGKLHWSQHQPSLITTPRVNIPVYSEVRKRWNFRKADWKRFCLPTGESR